MDLKRLSSMLMTSLRLQPPSSSATNDDDDDDASGGDRRAGSPWSGAARRRTLSSYTYSADYKCKVGGGGQAKRSHSSRISSSTVGQLHKPMSNKNDSPKTSPSFHAGQKKASPSGRKQNASTGRQRAVSLPQPKQTPLIFDGEEVTPVQLFEKWSGVVSNGLLVNGSGSSRSAARWSSFKYEMERKHYNNAKQRLDENSSRYPKYDRIRTFGVDAKGRLIDRGFSYRRKRDVIKKQCDDEKTGAGGLEDQDDDRKRLLSPTSLVADGDDTVFTADGGHGPAVNNYRAAGGRKAGGGALLQGDDGHPTKKNLTFKVWVVGAPEVGKTSLINQFANCELANVLGRGDSLEDETGRIMSILLNGQEVELSFIEMDIEEVVKLLLNSITPIDDANLIFTQSVPDAAVVMYTITNRKSFLEASDVLYHLRRPKNTFARKNGNSTTADCSPGKVSTTTTMTKQEDNRHNILVIDREDTRFLCGGGVNGRQAATAAADGPAANYRTFLTDGGTTSTVAATKNCETLLHKKWTDLPVFLVANKIDVERQRMVQYSEGQETSKTFGCSSFLEISVGLGHRTDELFTNLLSNLNEMRSISNRCVYCTFTDCDLVEDTFDDSNNVHCYYCHRHYCDHYNDVGKKSMRKSSGADASSAAASQHHHFSPSSRSDSGLLLSGGAPAAAKLFPFSCADHCRPMFHRCGGGGGRRRSKRRSNSFSQAGPMLLALGRRLARSCEDLIAKLIK